MIKSNEKGDIICSVCKRPLKQITASHLGTHGITMAQYRKRYKIGQDVSLAAESKSKKPKVFHG
jgi:predicted transcriptional regulator